MRGMWHLVFIKKTQENALTQHTNFKPPVSITRYFFSLPWHKCCHTSMHPPCTPCGVCMIRLSYYAYTTYRNLLGWRELWLGKKKKRREAPYLESGRSLARVVLQISSLCGFCMLMPDMWQPSQPLLNTLADWVVLVSVTRSWEMDNIEMCVCVWLSSMMDFADIY